MGGSGSALRSAYERTLRRLTDPAQAPQGGAGPRLGARLGPIPDALLPLLPVDPVPAAVLVGFIEREDPGILLTVRAAHLRKHAGQISFPGGRIEAGETPESTLVREFEEELSVRVSVEAPIDSYLFEVVPAKNVFIVTYGCALAGEFKPRLSDEHSEYRVCAVKDLPGVNLPRGYRESVERWSNAEDRKLLCRCHSVKPNNGVRAD